MITITREFGFDYGHRLLKHESKCKNVHGHRGKLEVTVSAPELDAVGRILDFGEIKARIGAWLDSQWDHGFLAEQGDPLIEWLESNGMKHRVLAFAPTAENLVALLGEDIIPWVLEGTPCKVVKVVLHETPNCQATWTAPGSAA